jgi:hypothetical protein
MESLKQFRPSSKWLVLLVGLAALAVTTAALMPHDDGTSEDMDCLVCKAGHQPMTELSADLVAEPPLTPTHHAPVRKASIAPTPVFEAGSPRAPPV